MVSPSNDFRYGDSGQVGTAWWFEFLFDGGGLVADGRARRAGRLQKMTGKKAREPSLNDIPLHQKAVQRHSQITTGRPEMSERHLKMNQYHPEMSRGHPKMAQGHPEIIWRRPKMTQRHPEISRRHRKMSQRLPKIVKRRRKMINRRTKWQKGVRREQFSPQHTLSRPTTRG
ncbi:MAG: hypothetical protein ACE5G1_14180 [bacterium]